jgi:hypothetical protein
MICNVSRGLQLSEQGQSLDLCFADESTSKIGSSQSNGSLLISMGQKSRRLTLEYAANRRFAEIEKVCFNYGCKPDTDLDAKNIAQQ